MSTDGSGIGDSVFVALTRETKMQDGIHLRGWVEAILRDEDGNIKQREVHHNIITQVGDQVIGERAFGGISGSPITPLPNQQSGAKLGTGSTAAAKTGAGAALVTYKTGSHRAVDTGFPTSALSGAIRRIAWSYTWAAGTATDAALAEAVIVNETTLTDATNTAANTLSRVVFGTAINKGASDSLQLTWNYDIGT